MKRLIRDNFYIEYDIVDELTKQVEYKVYPIITLYSPVTNIPTRVAARAYPISSGTVELNMLKNIQLQMSLIRDNVYTNGLKFYCIVDESVKSVIEYSYSPLANFCNIHDIEDEFGEKDFIQIDLMVPVSAEFKNYGDSCSRMVDPNFVFIDELLNDLVYMGKQLKENCKENRSCGTCDFFIKDGNQCKLSPYRATNVIPRDWTV